MAEAVEDRTAIEIDIGESERVPGILQLPRSAAPLPAVLALHGFTSRKDDMANALGRSLYKRGVACLSIDLPMHGARKGSERRLSFSDPLALIGIWRLALREAEEAIRYLSSHSAIDASRIGIAGYSLGAYIALAIAANEPIVKVVSLTAGGDLPVQTPFQPIVRRIADPIRSVRALHGRPLLMMHGRHDRTILPSQATTLFTAASDPKELRWHNGGHWPPPAVMDEVAEWLATQLGARPSAPPATPSVPASSSRPTQPRRAPRSHSQTRSDR